MKFSAVIVTRGDVDLGPALAPIVPLTDEIIIRRGHGGVWERWEAILGAKHELVYTQDDDCVVDVQALLDLDEDHWVAQIKQDKDFMTCNMPEWKRYEYTDGTALVGWGAFVSKAIVVNAMRRYYAAGPWREDDLFRRECDRVVTGLSPLHLVDVPFQHLQWANGTGRMCAAAGDPKHGEARRAIRERIEIIRKMEAR